jgi:mannose/fructose-specific phosphotransferase system component IIA
MSEPAVRGIVLAHGTMADGLVDAVRQITGAEADVLTPLSNRGLSPEAIAAAVRAHVHGPTIVFTDLQTGSCGFAVRRYCQDLPDLICMSGVNLPVLLEFVMHRALPLNELVPKILARGKSAIASSKFNSESNEHRAVSGG